MNPLRIDPSRTITLRRQFMVAMARRFRALRLRVRHLVAELDVFGLEPDKHLTLNVEPQQWRFERDSAKVALFMEWLRDQIEAGILERAGGPAGNWPAAFVRSAYLKGVARAWTDTLPPTAAADKAFYAGAKAQFLRDAFSAPVAVSKLELLYTRTFEQLKGITAEMSAKMSRVLADALANGRGAVPTARALEKEVEGMSRTRAMRIARTELMHAHAEGQLDSMARLGVEELGVMVEWLTAGDRRVCPRCAAMEGQRFKIEEAHGLLPLHPNCRCVWLPANVGEVRRLHPALRGGS